MFGPGGGCGGVGLLLLLLLLEGAQVEGGEGGLVEVSDVVEEDRGGGGGGDGDDAAEHIQRVDIGRSHINKKLRVFGLEVPESDGVVQGAGDEFVFARVYG